MPTRSPIFSETTLAWAAGGLLLAGALFMLPNGSLDSPEILSGFLTGAAIMLAGFFLALRQKSIALPLVLLVAIAARLILLFQTPGPDIFRYIWEGQVLQAGSNPYLLAPESDLLAPLRGPDWESIQFRSIAAVYPPLAEVVFAILATLHASVFFFKFVFVLADLTTGALLWFRFGRSTTLFYLWNPLILYAFAGGGHYDSFFLLALVAGWVAWDSKHQKAAVLALGAAVALKWMALPLLAWAGWRILRERGLRTALAAGMIGVLPFAASWIVITLWTGEPAWSLIPRAFAEYARSADLVPRLAGVVWPTSIHHNSWFLIPLALAWTVILFRAKSLRSAAEGFFFTTLILSPVIHAWY